MAVVLALLGITALVVVGVVVELYAPPTAVITGNDLRPRDRGMLRAEGILETDEKVVLFYSAGLFSIMEDGNIITERRVISYETSDGTLWTSSAAFDEISEVRWEEEGTFVSDSVISVTAMDGDWFLLYASTEGGGDERFMREIRERVALQRDRDRWRKRAADAQPGVETPDAHFRRPVAVP